MNNSWEKRIIYKIDEVDKIIKDEVHLLFTIITLIQKINCCFYLKKKKSFKAINIEFEGMTLCYIPEN